MRWWLTFFTRQKYRFDIGQGFMAIVNFSFVVLAASDKIMSVTGVPARVLVPVVVPVAIGLVWLVGFIFDRLRFMEAYQREANIRNEMLTKACKQINQS